MATTLAGNAANTRPANLLTFEQAEANKKAITRCLGIHTEHKEKLDNHCLLCIVRSVGWIEQGNKRESEAQALIASLPKSVVANAILAVRVELGAESMESHPWLWRSEYA